MPIIVLSARTTSHDKVAALDLGAVDYVTKPFDMNELVARLHAAVRRSSCPPPSSPSAGSASISTPALSCAGNARSRKRSI